MQIEDLIIDYLTHKIQKMEAVKIHNWNLAADIRDRERIISKHLVVTIITSENNSELLNYIEENFIKANDTFSWSQYDSVVEKYCLLKYKCGLDKPKEVIKLINRQKRLKDLGI